MQQRTGFLKPLIIILMLVFVSAMVMMLVNDDVKHTTRTAGFESPQISHNTPQQPDTFNDGLGIPKSMVYGTLDEFGVGIDSVAEFYHDINNDGTSDKITRTHIATGNDHDYDEYKIELNINGVMVNITPSGMRTTHGADCALRLIKFNLKPKFEIVIISRPFQNTWDTPSMATRTEYKLSNNQIVSESTINLASVCDVTELF